MLNDQRHLYDAVAHPKQYLLCEDTAEFAALIDLRWNKYWYRTTYLPYIVFREYWKAIGGTIAPQLENPRHG